jgi:hypothetical protein
VSLADRSPDWRHGAPHLRWSYSRSIWIFLRLLGVAYLAAFWSLGTQIRGLVGERGILPARELMAAMSRQTGAGGPGLADVLAFPTVFWLDASDGALVAACALGALLAILLVAGVATWLVLPLLWALYLSLSTVASEFLAFQWDTLLLETGLLALVVAPGTLVHRPSGSDPPPLARWLIWWLLFRLMFAAGLVKLASGDVLWRSLTALTVHYETQPLPTPLAFHAHHLPVWAHEAATAGALAIELIAPWFILGPRRLRHVACGLIVALQIAIALTGNYTFFNLLTIALALTLVDDDAWPRSLRPRTDREQAPAGGRGGNWAPQLLLAAILTIVTIPLSTGILAAQAGVTLPWHATLRPVQRALSPFRSLNPYGLFAVMTHVRPEIIIEGSADGETWRPYEFKYKPGDPRRAPPWVAPHQPRLDWQMWFAALDGLPGTFWFERFCRRLLEGEPAVVDLLGDNPFPDEPPRFVRGRVYTYRFASRERHRTEGVWWTRDEGRPYSPAYTRADAAEP